MQTNGKAALIFLKVETKQAKLTRIYEAIKFFYLKNKKIILFTPSAEAAQLLDNTLWHMSPEDFIPHSIQTQKNNEPICITEIQQNLNNAEIAFNLCETCLKTVNDFAYVFELFDSTQPHRKELSQRKMADYQSLGFTPTMR